MPRVTSLEKPVERLAHAGVDALALEELIALVLQEPENGRPAIDVARELMSEHGDLSSLAAARQEELANYPGMNVAMAAAVVASFQLARLVVSDPGPVVLRTAADVAAVATSELAGARRERVIVLVCDSANRLRRLVTVSEGALDRSLFPVREILNAVLRHDGRAFAVAHNHASGDPTPGQEDMLVTDELRTAARTVGLRFLEHVVVAGNNWRTVSGARRTLD